MSAVRALPGFLCIGLAVAACRDQRVEDVPAPDRIAVAIADLSLRGAAESPEAVREILAGALAGSRSFRLAGPGEPALPAVFDVRVLSRIDPPILALSIELQAPAELARALPQGLVTRVELERAGDPIVVLRDLPHAADRLRDALDLKLELARGSTPAVAAALGSADPNQVVLGVDWVRVHHLGEFAETLTTLVDHPDDRVALSAIECLGMVGSSRHAAVLVRLGGLSDPVRAERVYEALGELGGADAIGFLALAARNEADPDLAGVAEAALRRALVRGEGSSGEDLSLSLRGHRR